MIVANLTLQGRSNIDSKRFERKFKKVVTGIGAVVATELRPLVEETLGAEAPPVKYPIQWASPKQRRAYYATNGFGGGIPHNRTGAIRKSWRVIYLRSEDSGGVLQIVNRNPKAVFLYGSLVPGNNFQQRMHVNTGYPAALPVIQRLNQAGMVIARARFREALDSFGVFTAESNV